MEASGSSGSVWLTVADWENYSDTGKEKKKEKETMHS